MLEIGQRPYVSIEGDVDREETILTLGARDHGVGPAMVTACEVEAYCFYDETMKEMIPEEQLDLTPLPVWIFPGEMDILVTVPLEPDVPVSKKEHFSMIQARITVRYRTAQEANYRTRALATWTRGEGDWANAIIEEAV